MASIILTAVGTAVGGPFGGAIGAVIGGYIDHTFTMPMLFGRPVQYGPRLQDLSTQAASEGTPVKYVLGPMNRITGAAIFLSDLIEVREEEEVGGKGGGGTDQVTYTYFVDAAFAFSEPLVAIPKVWADAKVLVENDVASRMNDFASYPEGGTTPSSLLEAHLGAGNVPAYVHTSYITMAGLALADFGNRTPEIRIWANAGTISVGNAIIDIISRADLFPQDVDVSRVPGCLLGIVAEGPTSAASILEPIILAYDLIVSEQGGKLVFFKAGLEETGFAEEKHLGANSNVVFKRTDRPSRDLPQEVTVSFIDKDLDMQRGSVTERKPDARVGAVETYDLPLTLSSSHAKAIAQRLLWNPWLERETVEFSLPPRYIGFKGGDIIRIPYKNELIDVRITRASRGANMEMRFEGVTTQVHAIGRTAELDDPTYEGDTLYIPPVLEFEVAEFYPLSAEDTLTPTAYFFVAAVDPSAKWAGAVLYSSVDNENFKQVRTLPYEAVSGTIVDVTEDLFDDILFLGLMWDTKTRIRVRALHGQFESRSEAEVQAGANWFFSNGEVFAFCNAELVGENEWELSKFLRGLRGTELRAMTEGSRVWSVAGRHSVVTEPYATGASVFYRPVPTGGSVSEFSSRPFTPSEASTLAAAPGPVIVRGDPFSGPVDVSWGRRVATPLRSLSQRGPSTTPQYLLQFITHNPFADDVVHYEVVLEDQTEFTWEPGMGESLFWTHVRVFELVGGKRGHSALQETDYGYGSPWTWEFGDLH